MKSIRILWSFLIAQMLIALIGTPVTVIISGRPTYAESIHLSVNDQQTTNAYPEDVVTFKWWVENVSLDHRVRVEFYILDPSDNELEHRAYGWEGVGSESHPMTEIWQVPSDADAGVYICRVEFYSSMLEPTELRAVATVSIRIRGKVTIHLNVSPKSVNPGEIVTFEWWIENLYVVYPEYNFEIRLYIFAPSNNVLDQKVYGPEGVGSESHPVTETWQVPSDAAPSQPPHFYRCRLELYGAISQPTTENFLTHTEEIFSVAAPPPPEFDFDLSYRVLDSMSINVFELYSGAVSQIERDVVEVTITTTGGLPQDIWLTSSLAVPGESPTDSPLVEITIHPSSTVQFPTRPEPFKAMIKATLTGRPTLGSYTLTITASTAYMLSKSISCNLWLHIECDTVDFDFMFGGRIVSSDIEIFASSLGWPDHDGDGISDCWENAAVMELNPYVEFDEEEEMFNHPGDTVVNFAKVTPYPSKENPVYILIYYALTFTQDYGRFGKREHHGDIELVILAWRVLNPTTIKLEWVYTNAHSGETDHDGVWNAWERTCNIGSICMLDFFGECDYVDSEVFCSHVEFHNDRVKIQVAQGKHATYPSCQVCEEVILIDHPLNVENNPAFQFLQGLVRLLETLLQGLLDLFNISDEQIGSSQTVFVTYESTPHRPGLVPVDSMDFRGHDGHYILYWSMRNLGNRSVDSKTYRHIRIELDMLHCVSETDDDSIFSTADEIYMIVTGCSLHPETNAWSVIDNPVVDQSVDAGDDCTEIFSEPIVIFDGEISEESLIGFNVHIMEQDWSDSDDRRNLVREARNWISEQISGIPTSYVGPCVGGDVISRWLCAIGEDCEGGVVKQIDVYNVGEDLDHLFPPFTSYMSLLQFGFNEQLAGTDCSGKRMFCGGLGCDGCDGGPDTIMKKLDGVPSILKRMLDLSL